MQLRCRQAEDISGTHDDAALKQRIKDSAAWTPDIDDDKVGPGRGVGQSKGFDAGCQLCETPCVGGAGQDREFVVVDRGRCCDLRSQVDIEGRAHLP